MLVFARINIVAITAIGPFTRRHQPALLTKKVDFLGIRAPVVNYGHLPCSVLGRKPDLFLIDPGMGIMTGIHLLPRRRSLREACTDVTSARHLPTPCGNCSIRDICQRSCGDPIAEVAAGGDRRGPLTVQFHPLVATGLAARAAGWITQAGRRAPRHAAA
jgi:hypothetical protein